MKTSTEILLVLTVALFIAQIVQLVVHDNRSKSIEYIKKTEPKAFNWYILTFYAFIVCGILCLFSCK